MMIALAFATLSLVYWAALLLVCNRPGFPLDDPYIHMRFARNLFQDGQMAFNPGIPSSGSTAPLFPALIAGAFAVVRHWYAATYVVGAVFSLASAFVAYGLIRSWTGRMDLARWTGLLVVVISPTISQAYGGMESPVYSFLFLLGLWAYPKHAKSTSLLWAIGVWLRPEFLGLAPLIGLERLIHHRRQTQTWVLAWLKDMWPHVLIWSAVTALYMGYNYHQDQHLVPSTFEAKSLAVGMEKPLWAHSPYRNFREGRFLLGPLSVVMWLSIHLFYVGLSVTIICFPLALGFFRAVRARWRDESTAAAGWRIGLIVFFAYPCMRGLVDTTGNFLFQQHRYFAHMIPLFVVLVIGALPITGHIVHRKWWNWQGKPLSRQRLITMGWALFGFSISVAYSVISVATINNMQVTLGHWIRNHTGPGEVVATNDIGAMGFISGRHILDTVGLVEPAIVDHYLAGGTLAEYLQARKPAYIIVFPAWYPEFSARDDLIEEVHAIRLPYNPTGGKAEMIVYRLREDSADVPTTRPQDEPRQHQ